MRQCLPRLMLVGLLQKYRDLVKKQHSGDDIQRGEKQIKRWRGRQFHTFLISYREKFCKLIISSGLSSGSAGAGQSCYLPSCKNTLFGPVEGGVILFSMCLAKPQTSSWGIIIPNYLCEFSIVFKISCDGIITIINALYFVFREA